MHLVVCDSRPDASVGWQPAARSHGFTLSTLPNLERLTQCDHAMDVIVVDQSVLTQPLIASVRGVRKFYPGPQMMVTASGLSTDAIVDLMRCGVGHVLDQPLSATRLNQVLPEVAQEASGRKARQAV